MTEKHWYVIKAIGGKEKKVKEYIDAEIRKSGLEDLISQVLIPTEKIYQIRNGKKVSKERIVLIFMKNCYMCADRTETVYLKKREKSFIK